MTKQYKCHVCGKEHVKLWRPYMNTEPLICAKCAEERQAPGEYDKNYWRLKAHNGSFVYVGISTGEKVPLQKWEVNSEGLVPSYHGPGPKGTEFEMTDQLIINLTDVSKNYSSGKTTVVPAIPDEDGEFWGYTSVPEEKCN